MCVFEKEGGGRGLGNQLQIVGLLSKTLNCFQNSSRAVCGYCGLKFLRLGHLENHLRVHTGEKPYQCIICGRCFPYKSSLLKHPESHKVGYYIGLHTFELDNDFEIVILFFLNIYNFSDMQ